MPDDFLDDDPTFLYDEGEQVTLEALRDVATETERLLRARQTAYHRVFSGSGSADDVVAVVRDLARFCRASNSTFRADAREHAQLEGRREVWLRIRDHLDLPFDELMQRYTQGEQA